jgi:hypothetical protein
MGGSGPSNADADGSGRIIMDSEVMPDIIPMWISGESTVDNLESS